MSDQHPAVADLEPGQRRVLECLYQHFVDHSSWPTYTELDHQADLMGVDEPLAVMRSLAPGLLQGTNSISPPASDHTLTVSLRGLAVIATWNPDAASDLDLFAASVQIAVRVSDRTPPPKSAQFVGIELFRPAPGQSPPLEADVLRLGCLWHAAGIHLWEGFRRPNTVEWEATLQRQNLRAYRKVSDANSLLQVDRQRIEASDNLVRPAASSVVSGVGQQGVASATPTWSSLLPQPILKEVEPRIDRHGSDAITAAWVVLAELIASKTGLDSDGDVLINMAFGGNEPRLRLGPDTTAGNNLHRGYADLMRGLARMRNVQAHRGRSAVSELHAAAVILTIGDCYNAVSAIPDPA